MEVRYDSTSTGPLMSQNAWNLAVTWENFEYHKGWLSTDAGKISIIMNTCGQLLMRASLCGAFLGRGRNFDSS